MTLKKQIKLGHDNVGFQAEECGIYGVGVMDTSGVF